MSEFVRIENDTDGGNLFVRFEDPPGNPTEPEVPETPPAIAFRVDEITVSEENPNLVRLFFDLDTTHTVDVEVTVSLFAETPGAGILEPGIDFSWPQSGISTYTIPAGDAAGGIALDVFDDTSNEPVETHRFVLSAVEAEPQAGFDPGDEQTLEVTRSIMNLRVLASDQGGSETIQWEQAAITMIEGQGTTDVGVTLSAALGVDTTADIVQTSGPSTSGRLIVPSSVTIGANDPRVDIQITPLDDGVPGNASAFEFELQNPSGSTTVGTPATLRLTLDEQTSTAPPPVWGWEITSLQMGEPGTVQPSSAQVVVRLQNPADSPDLSEGTTFQVALSGTATVGTPTSGDYFTSSTGFSIAAFGSQIPFSITIRDDNDIEGIETILADLSVVSGGGSVDPATERLVVDVFDEDEIGNGADLISQFEYPGHTCTSAPGMDSVELRVSIQRTHGADVTVFVRHYAATAIGEGMIEGTHYTGAPSRITIPAGALSATATIAFPPAATATTLRALISELYTPSHGQIGDVDRHITLLEGDTDVDHVPPEPALTESDSFRIYADRMEEYNPDTGAFIRNWLPPGGNSTWQSGDCPFTTYGNELFRAWIALGNTDVRYLEAGRPLVVRVMEDIPFLFAFGGSAWYSMAWNQIGSFPVTRRRIRDLWVVGEDQGGGVRPKMGAWAMGVSGTEGNVGAEENWDGVDNVHLVGLDIVEGFGGGSLDRSVSSRGSGTRVSDSRGTNGLIRLNDCRLYHVLDDLDGSPYLGNSSALSQMSIRLLTRASYWFSDLEFGAATEHSCYVDQPQGLFLFARNTTSRYVGRTQVQVVARPDGSGGLGTIGAGGGAIGHGLLVIEGNTDTDVGQWTVIGQGENGTQAHKVQGFFGRCYFFNNTHQGSTATSQNIVNRGAIALICNGNLPEGTQLFEYPYASKQYWNVLYAEIENDTVTVTPATHSVFNAVQYTINGCYDVQVGEFDINQTPTFSRAGVAFNRNAFTMIPGYENSRRVVDQLGRTLPNPPSFIHNRDGGVVFTGAPGPLNGSLLAYAGLAQSDEKYAHYDTPEGPGITGTFDGFATNGTNSYDGTDPVP